jgi:hypothetical protein
MKVGAGKDFVKISVGMSVVDIQVVEKDPSETCAQIK